MSASKVSACHTSPRSLQEVQAALRKEVGEDFAVASDHPYDCTCDQCRGWWRQMGPDPDTNLYGPFGDSLLGPD